ncbi:hypothetical protein Taro_032842 [Colocasia esculenta]|uniref:Uncharacterized protein n=1 Tax=Colocasia esculenta TaxID=4460 RepID=A0A843W316_COLES|nr:hypothetical protein [Colocasia esculenta]
MLVFIPFANGAEIAAEMMEAGPPEAIPPPTTAVGGAEDAPRRTAPALFLPGASELPPGRRFICAPRAFGYCGHLFFEPTFYPPLAAIGGSLLPPSLSEVSLKGPDAFPGHDILWPDAPQEGQVRGVEGMLSLFMASARAVMEESSPPSIEAVRAVLRRSTLAYHLMGFPRDPWMAAMDVLWGEVRQRHQEAAARFRIQELRGRISQLKEEAITLDLRVTTSRERTQTLVTGRADFLEELAKLREKEEEIQRRITTCELSVAALDQGMSAAEAETAALERDHSYVRSELVDCEAALARLEDGGPGPDPGAIDHGICHLDLAYHCSLLAKEISLGIRSEVAEP